VVTLAEMIVGFMSSGPGLPVMLLYIALATIPMTLVHELGHALAARRWVGGDVAVVVGNVGKVVRMRLGKVQLTINALAVLPHPDGYAEFDASRATARGVLLVALAGPAASLAAGLVAALALSVAPMAGVLHDLVWAATLCGVGGVFTLVPLSYEERRGGPTVHTDGRLAWDATRVLLALR